METIPSSLFATEADFSQIPERIHLSSFGNVFMGVDLRQDPPRPVCLKYSSFRESEHKYLYREVSIMAQLQHETIMRLVGFVPPGPDRKPMLALELMENGTLERVLANEYEGRPVPDRWGPTKKSIVAFGTAVGMAYMHSKDILHRDLKHHNIFLNEDLEPVIGDFELARVQALEMTTNLGTPLFMAPELFAGEVTYTKSVDVFAYGVLLVMLFGCHPGDLTLDDGEGSFCNIVKFGRRILNGARLCRPIGVSDFLWDLITSCWAEKPEDRPSFVEIVHMLREHNEDWVFRGTDLLLLTEYEDRIVQGVDL